MDTIIKTSTTSLAFYVMINCVYIQSIKHKQLRREQSRDLNIRFYPPLGICYNLTNDQITP